jgi:hypothetical protein
MNERIVATCWTSAGDAAPMRASEASPEDPLDRVAAVAEAGYAGMGWVLDDLRAIRAGVGYAAVADAMASAGLDHVEVELASEWWKPDEVWRETWEELLEASDAFGGAAMIKAGTDQAGARISASRGGGCGSRDQGGVGAASVRHGGFDDERRGAGQRRRSPGLRPGGGLLAHFPRRNEFLRTSE